MNIHDLLKGCQATILEMPLPTDEKIYNMIDCHGDFNPGERLIIKNLSLNNPGAVTVLCKIMKDPEGPEYCADLESLGIKGSSIWVGYKYYCNLDIKLFMQLIKSKESEMISFIKEKCG